jgi:hypothetical protein
MIAGYRIGFPLTLIGRFQSDFPGEMPRENGYLPKNLLLKEIGEAYQLL